MTNSGTVPCFPSWMPTIRWWHSAGVSWAMESPKYLNSPETMIFNKSRTIIRLAAGKADEEKISSSSVKGYMDVIALHQAGFDNAIASLGTALTSGHANMIQPVRQGCLSKLRLRWRGSQGGTCVLSRS